MHHPWLTKDNARWKENVYTALDRHMQMQGMEVYRSCGCSVAVLFYVAKINGRPEDWNIFQKPIKIDK